MSKAILVPTDIPNPIDGGWLCVWMTRPKLWRMLWGAWGILWACLSGNARDGYRMHPFTAVEVAWPFGIPMYLHHRRVWRHYAKPKENK